jgi:hypothetical protein
MRLYVQTFCRQIFMFIQLGDQLFSYFVYIGLPGIQFIQVFDLAGFIIFGMQVKCFGFQGADRYLLIPVLLFYRGSLPVNLKPH